MNTTTYFSKKQKIFLSLFINFIIPIAGISTDIYLPSLPSMGRYFHTSREMIQLTVTSFVIAMSLIQLIAGPISDALGRKKMLVAAMLVQALSVIAILFSPNISIIMIARFVQGIGAAFMMVPTRAIINDVFDHTEIKKQFNYCTISFALGPIIGPFLGGYLQTYFNWQANFVFILIYILIGFTLAIFYYRETIATTKPFSISHIAHNYNTVLHNRYFVLTSLFVGIIWSYVALFNVTAPFLIQTVLHYSPVVFGHAALFIGIAWLLGNIINRLLFNIDIKLKTQCALIITLLTVTTMLALGLTGHFTLYSITIPSFIAIFCSAIMFPIYIGECLVIFKSIAASANACLFGIIWGVFSLFTAVATLLKVHSLIPIAIAFTIMSVIAIIYYYCLLSPKDH